MSLEHMEDGDAQWPSVADTPGAHLLPGIGPVSHERHLYHCYWCGKGIPNVLMSHTEVVTDLGSFPVCDETCADKVIARQKRLGDVARGAKAIENLKYTCAQCDSPMSREWLKVYDEDAFCSLECMAAKNNVALRPLTGSRELLTPTLSDPFSAPDFPGKMLNRNGAEPGAEVNPKDVMGARKASVLSVVSPISIMYEAWAMQYGAHFAPRADGEVGYGPYNWRENEIRASVYVDAALRHIFDYWLGEEDAPDSGVPHIGHAKACMGLIADAKENGVLIDDRPSGDSDALPALTRRIKAFFKQLSEERGLTS